jgi:hypothetical protein
VVAFVRDSAQVTSTDPHLTAAQGDALDPATVVAALEGGDAVISAIGRSRKGGSNGRVKGPFYAPAMRVILAGMASRGARRLIKASDTEWTIMQPGGLTGKTKGDYAVRPGHSLCGHGSTPRADLAEALVLTVTEGTWLRQAVVVAA